MEVTEINFPKIISLKKTLNYIFCKDIKLKGRILEGCAFPLNKLITEKILKEY